MFDRLLVALVLTGSGCLLDAPDADRPPAVRLLVRWDPGICGTPHRVVVELEDGHGVEISSSAPCELGHLTVGAPGFGVYRGRVYAWELSKPIRSVMPVEIALDASEVHWVVPTPV
jgi:hypothetical protein